MLSLTRDSPAAALMYLSSATPNKRSLGALNGLARTVAAIQGAIGPGVADSLLRFHFGRDLCIYMSCYSPWCVSSCPWL